MKQPQTRRLVEHAKQALAVAQQRAARRLGVLLVWAAPGTCTVGASQHHQVQSRQGMTEQGRSPVHAVLLGADAQQAQDPPVMVWGRGVVREADQVVVALLLASLGAVLQGVEASPRPHAGAAACLALPLLHPVTGARLHPLGVT